MRIEDDYYFKDIDHHTTIEHIKNNCTSNEHYKGILGGKAVAVFNGRIHVHPDAQKTDAIQNNQNLLLSDDAIIHTKPELEIYADDVKCTHGATVGQLDDKAMFYLRTRGLGTAIGSYQYRHRLRFVCDKFSSKYSAVLKYCIIIYN